MIPLSEIMTIIIGYDKIVKILIENGAVVNHKTNDLHSAALNGIKYLLVFDDTLNIYNNLLSY